MTRDLPLLVKCCGECRSYDNGCALLTDAGPARIAKKPSDKPCTQGRPRDAP